MEDISIRSLHRSSVILEISKNCLYKVILSHMADSTGHFVILVDKFITESRASTEMQKRHGVNIILQHRKAKDDRELSLSLGVSGIQYGN